MGVETVTYINDFNTSNPAPGDDRGEGDDHIRNIKTGLKNSLPNSTRPYYFPRAAAKTADYTVVAADLEKFLACDATADHIDITLPTLVAANDGWSIRLMKTDASANEVRIAGTINGDADGFNLTRRYQSVTLVWTGTAWLAYHGLLIVDQEPTFSSLTVSGVLNLTSTSHFALPGGTTAERPVGTVFGRMRKNSSLDGVEWQDAGGNWRLLPIAAPISAGFKNLVVQNNAATPNTQIDINADAVTVETSAGIAYRLPNIDLTVNCATNGVNGLDAGGLANNTWYYGYVIYNPTTNTVAGLVSTSTTNPTLPSGYTAFARYSSHRTNGSAQFHRTIQKGREVQYILSASVTTVLPVIATGSVGGAATGDPAGGTLVAASVSSIVPPTASKIRVTAWINGNGVNIVVAPNSLYGGYTENLTKSAPIVLIGPAANFGTPGGSNAATFSVTGEFMLEGTDIYWAVDNVGSAVNNYGGLNCPGYTDNI